MPIKKNGELEMEEHTLGQELLDEERYSVE